VGVAVAVAVGVGVNVAVAVGVAVGVAVAVAVAIAVAVAVGVAVAVAVGVAEVVAVAVAVAVGVTVGVAVAVAVGVAVAVAVGVVVAVAVAVGVGLGVGVGPAVYWIVNMGGLALSRVSKRFVVPSVDSSPITSQPKLVAGLSSHDCTSATICAELHRYCPLAPTDWLALTVAEKSPPWLVQKMVSKKRCRHVASLVVAAIP
jgi:hypothetical protein